MKAADWHTLYKIGLGISILLFFFGLIMMFYEFSVVGFRSSILQLALASFVVCGIYLLFAIFSYQKFKKAEKLENKQDLKRQHEDQKSI